MRLIISSSGIRSPSNRIAFSNCDMANKIASIVAFNGRNIGLFITFDIPSDASTIPLE